MRTLIGAGALVLWVLGTVGEVLAAEQTRFFVVSSYSRDYLSGYKQAFEAVTMAHHILTKDMDPVAYPPMTPTRGSSVVNRQRAAALGITLTPAMGIEQYEDGSAAMHQKETAP